MRALVFVLALAVLAPCVQALDAAQARGDGESQVRMVRATLLLRGEALVQVHGGGSLQLVDDVGHNLAPRAGGLPAMNGYTAWNRTTSPEAIAAGTLLRLRPLQPDARLIVVDADVTATTPQPWSLHPNRDQLLETSHVYRRADQSEYYYEYRARHEANWTAEATWATSGQLHIYVWGAEILADGPRGATTHVTGNWTSEAGLLERWHHNVFAVLTVDGELEAHGSGSGYADAIELVADHVVLDEATGTVASEAVAGATRLTGGRYVVQGGAKGLQVEVAESPLAVNGVAVRDASRWPWVAAAAGMLVVIALVAVLRGSAATWTRRSVEQIDAGRPRRAAWAAWRALLRRPPVLAWMILGHARMQLAHPRRAERAFAAAYREMSGEDRAVCAYEAARAAATARRPAQAGFWLRLAGQLDVSLLTTAMEEPDFRHVIEHPQFTRQVQLAPDLVAP